MTDWTLDVLENKWGQLKAWLGGCEKKFGKDGTMTVRSFQSMMNTLEELESKIDETIIEGLDVRKK